MPAINNTNQPQTPQNVHQANAKKRAEQIRMGGIMTGGAIAGSTAVIVNETKDSFINLAQKNFKATNPNPEINFNEINMTDKFNHMRSQIAKDFKRCFGSKAKVKHLLANSERRKKFTQIIFKKLNLKEVALNSLKGGLVGLACATVVGGAIQLCEKAFAHKTPPNQKG